MSRRTPDTGHRAEGVRVLARLLESTTRGARVATLLAVGAVLGVVIAAAALTGNATRFVTVADGAPSGSATAAVHGKSGEHSKAAKTKADKADKAADQGESEAPDPEDSTGSGGVHGSCVAAVAQDHSKVGGPHHNHGWVVSRAAHTCPNPRPSGSASD